MQQPYEMRFYDRQNDSLPLLTGVTEKIYDEHTSVRFTASSENMLLVLRKGQSDMGSNACLLRQGKTIMISFTERSVLCVINFRGSETECFRHLPPQGSMVVFPVQCPQLIAEAARKTSQVPEGCDAALYRCAQLLQILSCLPAAEEEDQNENCGKRAMAYIRENYMRPISVNDIAAAVGVSRSWLYRSFMDYAEQSPAMYLRDLRMRRAKSLLLHTNHSVQEIARTVGYEDPLYFSRVFSEFTGSSPSAYRKSWSEREM